MAEILLFGWILGLITGILGIYAFYKFKLFANFLIEKHKIN